MSSRGSYVANALSLGSSLWLRMPDLSNRPRDENGRLLPATAQPQALTAADAQSDPNLDHTQLDLHGLIGATQITPATSEPVQPAKPTTPTPAPPKHPPHLVQKALSLGATGQQLASWTTEQLRDEVDNALWQQNQWLLSQAQQNFENQQPKPAAPSAPPPTAPNPAAAADPKLLLEDDSFWDGHDPRLRELIRAGAEAKEELKILKAEREKDKAISQQREAQAYADRFEGCCLRNPEIFGTGTLRQKDVSEGDMAKRMIVDHLVRTLSIKGIPDGDVERKFDQFKAMLFGQKPPPPKPPAVPQAVPQATAKRTQQVSVPQPYGIDEWMDSTLIAPSAREEPELAPGPERAARSLAAQANGEAPHPVPPRNDNDIMNGFFS